MKTFLDSSTGVTAQNRTPLGVLGARDARFVNGWLYFRIGDTGVAGYRDTFLSRVDRGEALTEISPGHGRILNPDLWFNVYTLRSVGTADALGAERLADFDVDSNGALYVAGVDGWGIVVNNRIVFQDGVVNGVIQQRITHAGPIIALKGSTKRYALVSRANPTLFDCTNTSAPVPLSVRVPSFLDCAKSADESRVAIIDFDTHKLAIYTVDGLAVGSPPIYSGPSAVSVTTDGTRFFVLRGTSIDVLTPTGNTYTSATMGSAEMQAPAKITFGDGRIIAAGSDNGPWAWTILNVDGVRLSRIPFDVSATLNNQSAHAFAGIVYQNRPILCGGSIGAVYDPLATAPAVVVPDPLPAIPGRWIEVQGFPGWSQVAQALSTGRMTYTVASGPVVDVLDASGHYEAAFVHVENGGYIGMRIIRRATPPRNAGIGVAEFSDPAAAAAKHAEMRNKFGRAWLVSTNEGTLVVFWLSGE